MRDVSGRDDFDQSKSLCRYFGPHDRTDLFRGLKAGVDFIKFEAISFTLRFIPAGHLVQIQFVKPRVDGLALLLQAGDRAGRHDWNIFFKQKPDEAMGDRHAGVAADEMGDHIGLSAVHFLLNGKEEFISIFVKLFRGAQAFHWTIDLINLNILKNGSRWDEDG
jgi:hypothetical protein